MLSSITNVAPGGSAKSDCSIHIKLNYFSVSMAHGHFGYCDACNDRQQITGLRFKCVPCKDYDLCMKCYMGDEHNKNHAFVRLNYRLGKA
jgi:hypothetical protein